MRKNERELLLYNLHNDPEEKNNIYSTYRKEMKDKTNLFSSFGKEILMKGEQENIQNLPKETVKGLRSLGYTR